MKNEFVLAFNEVIEEKQLPKEVILKALESAMVSAYRRAVNASNAQYVEAKVDPDTGKVAVFAEKEVVEIPHDTRTEVSLQEAKKYNADAEIGMMVVVESTPADFGRVAAQTARQVIQQRIRDAERQAQLEHYQKQLGEIISGVVQATSSQGLTIGLEMHAEGFISRKDMIPGERFHLHERVRALVSEAKDSPRGPQIILSRTHRDFLRRLLENEVPEIYHGVVEVRSIAREPGERAKVAVSAAQSGIDPVGACVGIRGVRIQTIVRELHDEKIDVIEWNSDPTVFIAKAISPARVSGVFLTDKPGSGKTATVVVTEDQLSLAIGRDGQNARLAAKLTGWRIDIKSVIEAAADSINKLKSDPSLQTIANAESETMKLVDDMLARKADGRPLTPEEYDQISQFIDRVERRTIQQNQIAIVNENEQAIKTLRDALPEDLFNQNILDSSLPEHVSYILQEAGFSTVGELVLQMKFQQDDILRLQGIGPRAMAEINHLVEEIDSSISTEQSEESATQVETLIPESSESPTKAEETTLTEEVTVSQPVSAEAAPTSEDVTLPVAEAQIQISDSPVSEEEEEEKDIPFDQLLTFITPEFGTEEEEDEDADSQSSDKKKKKKKKKHIEIEYDPERDVTMIRKKHKRSGSEWGWEE